MLLARLMGMAKPTFMARAGLRIAELMPMTSPAKLNSGPPEFPWLMAASVWMKSWKSTGPSTVRFLALTIPMVTVWPSPSGLPIAST